MSQVTTDSNYMYCVVSDIGFRKVLSPESWEVCLKKADGTYDIAFTVGKNVNERDFVGACELFVQIHQSHQNNIEDDSENAPTAANR